MESMDSDEMNEENKCEKNEEPDLAERSTGTSTRTSTQGDYNFFGEDTKEQEARIKKNSPFKDLKSYKIIHLIVKSGSDMKEEQFALQLVSQFDQIFKAEKLKLLLTPYEILSLGKGNKRFLNEPF